MFLVVLTWTLTRSLYSVIEARKVYSWNGRFRSLIGDKRGMKGKGYGELEPPAGNSGSWHQSQTPETFINNTDPPVLSMETNTW